MYDHSKAKVREIFINFADKNPLVQNIYFGKELMTLEHPYYPRSIHSVSDSVQITSASRFSRKLKRTIFEVCVCGGGGG